MNFKTDAFLAIIAAAVAGAAIASLPTTPDRPATYQTEAEQGDYAGDFIYGAQGCPEADDPSETVLAQTYAELVNDGCTTIFEL
jgi:hypothetical protein